MSKWIRLRDAIAYCEKYGIDLGQFTRVEDIICKCCTCGNVKSWIRQDAGHCIGRGIGGSSGTYFDERNLACQCKQCNGFKQGARPEFEEHLREKYGDDIINILENIHIAKRGFKWNYTAIEFMAKNQFEALKRENGF